MNLHEFDQQYYNRGITSLAGVDEAGRGPLAGDVYAAAVVLPPDFYIEAINDSKKLTPKKREELYDVITENAVSWCVATANVQTIEKINILNATYLAMRRAVEGLSSTPELVLVDGNRSQGLPAPFECVVKGDGKSQTIAAASILAKVARDRYMTALSGEYPEYGFDKHKGYGTKLHIEQLHTYGPCPAHRMSFLTKILGDSHE